MASSPSFADIVADALNVVFSPPFVWFVFAIYLVLMARVLWLSWRIGGLLVEYVRLPVFHAYCSDFLFYRLGVPLP